MYLKSLSSADITAVTGGLASAPGLRSILLRIINSASSYYYSRRRFSSRAARRRSSISSSLRVIAPTEENLLNEAALSRRSGYVLSGNSLIRLRGKRDIIAIPGLLLLKGKRLEL